MVHGDRHQRRLHRHAGHQEEQQVPRRPAPPAVVARCAKPAHERVLVERDDRGDGGERQLETRPGQRLGPQQQHDERPRRDQSQRHRLAPDRQRDEDQQRGDAASDRRHFGAGQPGIADRRRRPGDARDQRQSHPQRQRRPQREQLDDEDHRRADHRGDVEPAHRQQVREPRGAHRLGVLLRDAADITGRERGRHPADASRQRLADVRGERFPKAW